MKISIHTLIAILEQQLTEEKCDRLAEFVSKKTPGPKVIKGLVRGAIDEATPGALFLGLRAVFPNNEMVSVSVADLQAEDGD